MANEDQLKEYSDIELSYIKRNQVQWNTLAAEFSAPGREGWKSSEPHWGVWSIPESKASILPENIKGLNTLELGCGTAYVSAWLHSAGAHPVGLDATPRQLANAAANQIEFDVSFPLVLATAEKTPFQSGTFDLVISEYGACLWSDPYAWIPEASRILKPGGKLIFLTNSFLSILCLPDQPESSISNLLIRSQFDLHRVEWPNDPEDNGVEFHLSHGNWIKLFRANDLEVEDLLELRPGDDAKTRFEYLTREWADQWVAEEVWKLQKKSRKVSCIYSSSKHKNILTGLGTCPA